MPEIEPFLADDGVTRVSPPSPRTALFWDGTHWHVPRVDDHGRVQVRGEDQLFSLKGLLVSRRAAVISGAGGFVDSATCPANEIWIVTTISVSDDTSPTTEHYADNRHPWATARINTDTQAFAAGQRSEWSGHTYLGHNGTIRANFVGGLAGDTCTVDLTGFIMTEE